MDEGSADTLADGAAGKKKVEDEGLPTIDKSHYTIDREIARGGMGRIFTAHDRRLGRNVAVKEVIAREEALVARFDREVRLTARLQHPGIVSIYEAGRWSSGEPFYAMRLIEGRPLSDVIKEAKTLADRLALLPKLLAVAEAMAYAHDQRIIHRDLKPQNVLVGRFGETVVIDWGLAKDLDDASADSLPGVTPAGSESITVFGSVMGTPSYMPVEQATGQLVDERADVYAIGSILYQTLSGQMPYPGKTADRVLDALVAGPPPRLTNLQRDIPDDLVAIVERAMARDPAQRYKTANELADDLRRYTTGQLVASHAYTTRELVARWLKRHRGAVAVGAVAALALVGVGIASYAKVVDERDRADRERDVAVAAKKDSDLAQAAMLVDRARATVASGTPARAAPLLAAAVNLGASGSMVDALAGEIEAALPVPAWTKRVQRPDFTPDPVKVKELVGKTGTSGEASAALDPSGALLAIATPIELSLWDVKTMTKRASATGCTDEDQALDVTAVSSAGAVVGVCRALDGTNGRALAVWKPGGALVVGDMLPSGFADVATSRDGTVVGAVETTIGSPRLVSDGVRVSLGALPGVAAIAVSDDGTLAATGTSQGLVQVWEVGSARELAVVDLGEPVVALALANDQVIAAGKRGTETAWPLAQLARANRVGGAPDRTIVALRGTMWASATAHDVQAFEMTGEVIGKLDAPSGAVFDVGATLGGSGMIAAIAHRGDPNKGGTASAVIAGAEIALAEPRPLGATLSDDEKYLFAGGQIIDLASKRVVGTQTPITSACFTPRPDRAACFADWKGTGAQQVALYKLPDGARLEPKAHPLPPAAVVFAGTHDAVYVGACTDELSVIDADTGEVRPPIPLEQSACVRDLEVSDASGLGVAALATRRVVVFDLASGKRTGVIVLHDDLEALAVAPAGDHVALATSDGHIGVYDTRAHVLVAMLHVDGEGAGPLNLRLSFPSDAELVATTEHWAWRIPWTLPHPPGAWRARSMFVRDGLDVVLGPR